MFPTVKVRFFGPKACFCGPKKDEPTSYPGPTPSASRALMDSILWKPAIRWHILRVYLLSPLVWFHRQVNEIKDAASLNREIVVDSPQQRDQRTILGLKQVDFVVEAFFVFTEKRHADDNAVKFSEMFNRRLAKGQCYRQPYLGRSDFPASFEAAPEGFTPHADYLGKTIDIGSMLLDRTYGVTKCVPEFFHAEIRDGVLVEKGKDRLPYWAAQEESA